MMAMAVLVPGGHGLLGTELACAAGEEYVLIRPSSSDLDITDAAAVTAAVRSFVAAAGKQGLPMVVINAAAYTAADAAERDASVAYRVNSLGPHNLGTACRRYGVPLIHVSSDYVFDGNARVPYEPGDTPNPLNVYGRTKLAGERALLDLSGPAWVIRTAWLLATRGDNFLTRMMRLEHAHSEPRVVHDQVGSPTWAPDLAAALLTLVGGIASGFLPRQRVLHYANAGSCSRYHLARAIFTALGADPGRVLPCSTAEFPRLAPRPAYSVLGLHAWQDERLPAPRHWADALFSALATRS